MVKKTSFHFAVAALLAAALAAGLIFSSSASAGATEVYKANVKRGSVKILVGSKATSLVANLKTRCGKVSSRVGLGDLNAGQDFKAKRKAGKLKVQVSGRMHADARAISGKLLITKRKVRGKKRCQVKVAFRAKNKGKNQPEVTPPTNPNVDAYSGTTSQGLEISFRINTKTNAVTKIQAQVAVTCLGVTTWDDSWDTTVIVRYPDTKLQEGGWFESMVDAEYDEDRYDDYAIGADKVANGVFEGELYVDAIFNDAGELDPAGNWTCVEDSEDWVQFEAKRQ